MIHDTLPPAPRTSLQRRLDHIGIGLSGLCALHCLATLLVISALGLFDPAIHRIGLAMALAVAAMAIGWGLLRHRRMLPFVIASAGLALMTFALVVPHGANEFVLTLAGVVVVSFGHLLNIRALG
jgi:hypothetical protein